MIERRQDYLLDMIQRASEALAALLVQITPGEQAPEDDKELERALDDVFSGLDAHAHQLDAATLRALLRSDERALLFAILQARKGALRLQAGDADGGEVRVRCARELLELLIVRGSPLGEVARPLALVLAEWPG
jgi:hypothetical protein